ncbi:tRNA glutamyl-Q(34) synthetase GluQRS [Afifella pfennigii]|uniref:tRNA glutamyl-Q(34) synthetase GluQRS n=1 Tax=Afifella pfennigii TaxID=209897 RepID=UPI00047CCE56|nr:tRNA glutamyl-Q(34) synthetase GluQRS [Afifella pfennigii]
MPASETAPPVLRFAPSPNGYLHLGHAYSALSNEAAARRLGGRLYLRMEDTDPTRARAAFATAILEDLAWLCIAFEEKVLFQSERLAAYAAALGELERLGLVYPAFLSRSEIAAKVAASEAGGKPWPRDPDGAPLYPGPERDWPQSRRRREMTGGRPYALRLDMRRATAGAPPLSWRETDPFSGTCQTIAADPGLWGDVVLARKEVRTSYHLAVTVDDAFQGVTHIVRGMDLKPATAVHRLLQHLLALPEPSYHHHRLILDEEGRKLAKSAGATALRDLRAAGRKPGEIRAALGFALS